MEVLLVYEVKRWEQLFWNKFKAFLDQIGNDRAEEEERLIGEWRANFWKRTDARGSEKDVRPHQGFCPMSNGENHEWQIMDYACHASSIFCH